VNGDHLVLLRQPEGNRTYIGVKIRARQKS